MDFNLLHPEILTRDNASVFAYQHQPSHIHGPQQAPKFWAHKWVFQFQSSQPHCISMHHFNSAENKQHPMHEIELFFCAPHI